ncbi:MAG: FAD:protein FMN transferase [Marinobacterium sp.]|nr:FAD:protein FMN transferase [Marinobacterium sp.]
MIHKFSFQAMTVHCELQLVMDGEQDARQLADRIIKNTLRLQQKYNFHADNSWLNRTINQRTQQVIELDDETAAVLAQVRQLSTRLEGQFDITVGTLKPCFRQRSQQEALKLRKRLLKFMGPQQWQLDGNRLEFANPQCRFDLGGVIKEHAVDQAVVIARETGLKGALINFGGDLYVHGTRSHGDPFRVAVKNPQNPREMLFALELQNQALTTSGHYERHQSMGKQKVSHILGRREVDPRLLSVTVVSPSVLTSGLYSTALTLQPDLPLDDDTHAVMVDNRLQLHQSHRTLDALSASAASAV